MHLLKKTIKAIKQSWSFLVSPYKPPFLKSIRDGVAVPPLSGPYFRLSWSAVLVLGPAMLRLLRWSGQPRSPGSDLRPLLVPRDHSRWTVAGHTVRLSVPVSPRGRLCIGPTRPDPVPGDRTVGQGLFLGVQCMLIIIIASGCTKEKMQNL